MFLEYISLIIFLFKYCKVKLQFFLNYLVLPVPIAVQYILASRDIRWETPFAQGTFSQIRPWWRSCDEGTLSLRTFSLWYWGVTWREVLLCALQYYMNSKTCFQEHLKPRDVTLYERCSFMPGSMTSGRQVTLKKKSIERDFPKYISLLNTFFSLMTLWYICSSQVKIFVHVHSLGSYELTEAEGVQRGTKIVAHLRGDSYDFAKEQMIKGQWKLIVYSSHTGAIAYHIQVP